MDKLIQTDKFSIIYGEFKGEPNQELFRCPRELDDKDLGRYINEHGALVGFESDCTEDLRDVPGKELIGYYRMYYRNSRWYGRWMPENGKLDNLDIAGVQKIINWIADTFTGGCDYYMKDYFANSFQTWGGNHRYLIRPIKSVYYKVMIDTTYGNEDYPVRIYVYHKQNLGES